MENALRDLFGFLVLLGFVVWGIGMYHQLAFYRLWRSEKAAGRGHWHPMFTFSRRIPEVARPQRNRYVWAVAAFFVVLGVARLIHPLATRICTNIDPWP